jgi:hypothetical protein
MLCLFLWNTKNHRDLISKQGLKNPGIIEKPAVEVKYKFSKYFSDKIGF